MHISVWCTFDTNWISEQNRTTLEIYRKIGEIVVKFSQYSDFHFAYTCSYACLLHRNINGYAYKLLLTGSVATCEHGFTATCCGNQILFSADVKSRSPVWLLFDLILNFEGSNRYENTFLPHKLGMMLPCY